MRTLNLLSVLLSLKHDFELNDKFISFKFTDSSDV